MRLGNLKTLCMLSAGALATLGLASCRTRKECGGEQEIKIQVEEVNINNTAKVQTNPLEKQGGSYYV